MFHTFTALQTREGQIPYWNLLLLYPYHAGLRTKLWIQRRVSTEPHWTLITDGWSVCFACHQASMLFSSCSLQISHHDVLQDAKSASAEFALKKIPALCYASKFPVPKPFMPQQEEARHSSPVVMTYITKLSASCHNDMYAEHAQGALHCTSYPVHARMCMWM